MFAKLLTTQIRKVLFPFSDTEEHVLGQFEGNSGGKRLKVMVSEGLINDGRFSRKWDPKAARRISFQGVGICSESLYRHKRR